MKCLDEMKIVWDIYIFLLFYKNYYWKLKYRSSVFIFYMFLCIVVKECKFDLWWMFGLD